MTMSEILAVAMAFVAGVALGVIFFAGLWWTVRKGVSTRCPALWFLGSLLLRSGIVLAGFYLVSTGRWQRLVLCLIGFVIAQISVTSLSGPPLRGDNSPANEARHAP
jgi:F1F0 ATPase subunit 2